MHRTSCWLLSLAVAGLAGCRSKEPRYTDDRVRVDAPFVRVRVGEQGGASVQAPFTRVETPRYRAGQPVTPQPIYSSPARQTPAVPRGSTEYQSIAPNDASWRPVNP